MPLLSYGMKVLSSEKLDDVIHGGGKEEGLSDSVLLVIREMYGLDKEEVLKYRQFQWDLYYCFLDHVISEGFFFSDNPRDFSPEQKHTHEFSFHSLF